MLPRLTVAARLTRSAALVLASLALSGVAQAAPGWLQGLGKVYGSTRLNTQQRSNHSSFFRSHISRPLNNIASRVQQLEQGPTQGRQSLGHYLKGIVHKLKGARTSHRRGGTGNRATLAPVPSSVSSFFENEQALSELAARSTAAPERRSEKKDKNKSSKYVRSLPDHSTVRFPLPIEEMKQLDMKIDYRDPAVKKLRRLGFRLKAQGGLTPEAIVTRVQEVVRDLDKERPQDEKGIGDLTKKSLKRGQVGLKLNKFFRKGLAVCREKSIATHVALEAAGLEVRTVNGELREDGERPYGHMWNEVKIDGKWRIVDTVNPEFNWAQADKPFRLASKTRNGKLFTDGTVNPRVKGAQRQPTLWITNHRFEIVRYSKQHVVLTE